MNRPAEPSIAAARGVADLLVLQQRLRSCNTVDELGHLVSNETRMLAPYVSAALWIEGRVEAIAGLPTPVKEAPFTRWIGELGEQLGQASTTDPILVERNRLPAQINEEWSSYLPGEALWAPIPSPWSNESLVGALLLVRDEPWRPPELRLVAHWTGAVGHALEALRLKGRKRWNAGPLRKVLVTLLVASLVAVQWLPVRLSALASAEVVPFEPLVVRSSLDGVVGEVEVRPNQRVEKGALLTRLDNTSLVAKQAVARQELEIARAERLRAEQAAVVSREASSELPILAARVAQREAELAYVEELLSRVELRAARGGVVLMDEPEELEGRPVRIGERILSLADPERVELEIQLPVGDSLRIEPGAAVTLHLNVAPEKPLSARVRSIDHQARLTADGLLAYRIRGQFDGDSPPRIGLRGTARIEGSHAPLYYYLFRRPFAAVRQFLGW